MKLALRVPALAAAFCYCAATAAADDVTGTWAYSGKAHAGMWLSAQQSGDSVRFQLEISRGAPSYNSGWIEGSFALAGTAGVFETDEYGNCAIRFDFGKSDVRISQTAPDCGFGFGVSADGVLKRKSRRTPKFSDGDPR